MRTHRFHLLSLVVTLVAITLGVAVGAGPLAEDAEQRLRSEAADLRADRDAARREAAALHDRLGQSDAFVREVVPELVDGRLDGRSVTLVTLPGVGTRRISQTRQALVAAGATVHVSIRVRRAYVDPDQARSPLEDLALRLVPPNVEFPDGLTSIERVGIVLARATVAKNVANTREPDERAAELLAGLEALDALDVRGEAGRRSDLAVLVASDRSPRDRDVRRTSFAALIGLAAALDAGGDGAVVTGGPRSAARGGFVAALRRAADESRVGGVSTVDSAGTRTGAPALVLALAEQSDGDAGAYGLGPGVDGLLPPLAAGNARGSGRSGGSDGSGDGAG